METREEAYKDYTNGMKYKDIAKKYGISVNTVKSWASRYWKQKKLQPKNKKGCNQTSKKLQPKQDRRGAPDGNKNAVGNRGGNGAPVGNKFAWKHGGYSEVRYDVLTEDEKKMIGEMPEDEEQQLMDILFYLDVRERRLMQAINKYRDMKGGLYVDNVSRLEKKKTFANEEDKKLYEELRKQKIDDEKISYLYEEYSQQTDTRSVIGVVERLESELTRIQGKKIDCVRALAQVRKDKKADLVGGDGETSTINSVDASGAEVINIYLPDNGRDTK